MNVAKSAKSSLALLLLSAGLHAAPTISFTTASISVDTSDSSKGNSVSLISHSVSQFKAAASWGLSKTPVTLTFFR